METIDKEQPLHFYANHWRTYNVESSKSQESKHISHHHQHARGTCSEMEVSIHVVKYRPRSLFKEIA